MKYEIRKLEWPFKYRQFPRFWKRKGWIWPWRLYRDGVLIAMFKTKEEAEAAKPSVKFGR